MSGAHHRIILVWTNLRIDAIIYQANTSPSQLRILSFHSSLWDTGYLYRVMQKRLYVRTCDYFLLRNSVNLQVPLFWRCVVQLLNMTSRVTVSLRIHSFSLHVVIQGYHHKYVYGVDLYFSGCAHMSVYICICSYCSRCKTASAYVKVMRLGQLSCVAPLYMSVCIFKYI